MGAHEVVVLDPSDSDLWGLYASAALVLHPSLAEGFGLPMLEAASVGTPFLSSPVGAAEDIAVASNQIAALDLGLWAERIHWALENRENLSDALHTRATAFNWQRTAAAILDACFEQRDQRA